MAIKAVVISPLLLITSHHSSIGSVGKNTDQKLTKKIKKNQVAKSIPEQKKQSNRYEKYGMKYTMQHAQESEMKQDTVISQLAELSTTQGLPESRYDTNRPSPIYRRPPDYPRQALAMRIEGKVVVRYDVDSHGRVTNICIISAKPNMIFNRSIQNAMRFWQYEVKKAAKGLLMTFIFNRDKSVKFHHS